MPARADVIMFVGPTMADVPRAAAMARARGVRLRPPIRRRDIPKLLARRGRAKPGVLVIVDGLFHDALAVGHAEIRDALAAGWKVWGLSSMGAIRAREMESLGMRGFGAVFRRFREDDDFQDDEVAILHQPTRPYRPSSEPLIHLRVALDHCRKVGLVRSEIARRALAVEKGRWYGDRSVGSLLATLREKGVDIVPLRHEVEDFARFRIKGLDLAEFLEKAPWMIRP